MRISEIKGLIDRYGFNTTLGEILNDIQGDKIYECPKCHGRGQITIKYNCYPNNLPDSGFAYEAGYKDIMCDLCNGEGYTAIKYKPRMVQDGWEST